MVPTTRVQRLASRRRAQGGEAYCTKEKSAHRGQPHTRAGRPTELPWCLPAQVRKEATAAAGVRVSLAPRGLWKRAGRSNAPLRG